tara:strand:+ start:208 stop:351 length:144 start_codon:yes stop_codon:yes gene_type:complete
MAATKPTRGNRTKTNTAKKVKAKTNPMDKKPKKTAMSGGNGKKRKNA